MPRRLRMRAVKRRYGHSKTAVREVGHCQVCEHRVKLSGGVTVLHGYKRPGYGHVIGNCPGMNYPPYEVSADRAASYSVALRDHIEDLKKRVAELKSGAVTTLTRVGYSGKSRTYTKGEVEIAQGGFTIHPFEQALEREIHEVEGQAWHLTNEAKRLERRVANWQPKPIITFEEHLEEEKAKKATNRAARLERAAARDAKKAATAAKQEALKVRRAAEFEEMKHEASQLVESMATMDKSELDKRKTKLGKRIKKARTWLYWNFGPAMDGDLIVLGMAKRDDSGYVRYFFF